MIGIRKTRSAAALAIVAAWSATATAQVITGGVAPGGYRPGQGFARQWYESNDWYGGSGRISGALYGNAGPMGQAILNNTTTLPDRSALGAGAPGYDLRSTPDGYAEDFYDLRGDDSYLPNDLQPNDGGGSGVTAAQPGTQGAGGLNPGTRVPDALAADGLVGGRENESIPDGVDATGRLGAEVDPAVAGDFGDAVSAAAPSNRNATAAGVGAADLGPSGIDRTEGAIGETDDLYEDYDSLMGQYDEDDSAGPIGRSRSNYGAGPRLRTYYTEGWYGEDDAFNDWYDGIGAPEAAPAATPDAEAANPVAPTP